jgi:two-component system, cell cycle response regulator
VLPETALDGALSLAEDLRARTESNEFVFQSETIPLTISLGCAQLESTDKNALDLIQRADDKMYEAKRSGRNRVCA